MRKNASQSRAIGDFPLCFCNTRKICHAREISDAKPPKCDCDGVFFLDMTQAASSCSSTTKAVAAQETQTMPKSKSKTKNKQGKSEIASAKHHLQADSGSSVGLHQKKTKTKSTATIKPVCAQAADVPEKSKIMQMKAASSSGGTKGNKKTSPGADGTAEPNTAGSDSCAAAKKRRLRSK